MNYSKELRPENGSGYLVLKSGTSEPVQWEIDSRSDGALDGGRVRGTRITSRKPRKMVARFSVLRWP